MKLFQTKGFTTVFSAMVICAVMATSASAADVMKWAGCGITKKAFMAEAARAYKDKTGKSISLAGGGATKGIRMVNAGEIDIGGNCRPALSERFAAEEGDAYMTVVAWDALVPIVHKDNPVSSISTQQLKDMMLGKINNWKDLGGPDAKIIVVARKGDVSGVGYMTRKIIFGDPHVDYAPDALKLDNTGPVENKVKTDLLAVGLTGMSSAQKDVQDGKIKVLKVDGNAATQENIASGAYSTFRPLFLTTKGKPAGDVKAFLDWLLSDEGQSVIESAGTVSLRQGKGLKAKFQHWESIDRIVNFDSIP
jgi:phosphate transport system substrate-binding protein